MNTNLPPPQLPPKKSSLTLPILSNSSQRPENPGAAGKAAISYSCNKLFCILDQGKAGVSGLKKRLATSHSYSSSKVLYHIGMQFVLHCLIHTVTSQVMADLTVQCFLSSVRAGKERRSEMHWLSVCRTDFQPEHSPNAIIQQISSACTEQCSIDTKHKWSNAQHLSDRKW